MAFNSEGDRIAWTQVEQMWGMESFGRVSGDGIVTSCAHRGNELVGVIVLQTSKCFRHVSDLDKCSLGLFLLHHF